MGIGIGYEVQITYIARCQWDVGYICYPELVGCGGYEVFYTISLVGDSTLAPEHTQ